MNTASRRLAAVRIMALSGVLMVSGCASKKYVRDQVAGVDTKVGEVSNQVRENGERIDTVDGRARQGIADAAAANTAAAAADTKAAQAQTAATGAQNTANSAQQTATTASQGVTAANTRISTIETRISNLDRYTAGPATAVMFRLNSSTLDDAAKGALDGIASQVASMTSGFLIEIQGFASSDGDAGYNTTLSQRRAETVQRYLVSKNVPLFRISMLGLGEDKPVGDNSTRAGREQNRRVEVRILRAN